MNNGTYLWLALLGQTALIIGAYIFAFRGLREVTNHLTTFLAHELERAGESRQRIYEKLNELGERIARIEGP